MFQRIAWYTVVLVLIFSISPALSEVAEKDEATTTPKDRTEQHYQSAKQQESPPAVEIPLGDMPPRKTEHRTGGQQSDKQDETSISDREMVVYTGKLAEYTLYLVYVTIILAIIAFGQFMMFLRQLRLLDQSTTQGKIAASAAKDNSDLAHKEFISSHRPKLLVRRITHSISQIGQNAFLGINYEIVNVGDTPANVIETSEFAFFPKHVGDKIENPYIIPPYNGTISRRIKPLASGETYVFTYRRDAIDLGNQSDFVDEFGGVNTDHMIFFGFVIYEDMNGRKRKTAFMRQYDRIAQRYSPINDPDYEYQD